MSASVSLLGRQSRLLVFVFTCCCVLLGYQSALFWRWARTKSTLPTLGLLDAPSLVSNDDDSKPTVPPPWLMPWFASKEASSVGIDSSNRSANEVTDVEDDDDVVAPDGNAADGSDDKGDLDDDDSFDDALKESALVPVGWERSHTATSLVSEADSALAASRWSAFELRSDDMVPSQHQLPVAVSQQRQQPQKTQQPQQHQKPHVSPRDEPKTVAVHKRVPHFKPLVSIQPNPEVDHTNKRFSALAASVSTSSGSINGSLHTSTVNLLAKLDALVASSIAEQKVAEIGGQKRRGIAFLKTYKCGSSTLGSVLFRYASRHQQRMPRVSHNIKASLASQQQQQPLNANSNGTAPSSNGRTGICNVALQHIQAAKWRFAFEWYTRSVQRPFVFVTILREPLSHYASWAHFYKLPETSTSRPPPPDIRRTGKQPTDLARAEEVAAALRRISPPRPLTLDEFVMSSLARKSPMAHSIGLYKQSQLPGFVDTFSLLILMERFDEGLILLRRLLGWSLIDLTYLRINDSHQAQSLHARRSSSKSNDHGGGKQGFLRRSWDGLTVTPSPPVSTLATATKERITELTAQLDGPLYALAKDKFEAQVQAAGPTLHVELRQLKGLQEDLSQLCAALSADEAKNNAEVFKYSGGGKDGIDYQRSDLTRANFTDGGAWTAHLTHGWRKVDSSSSFHRSPPKGFWACRWYALADLQYEKQIGRQGLAGPVGFTSVDAPPAAN